MGEKCVFLDRDRTITEDPGYLTDPEAVRLLPGVDLALRNLARAGFKLVVVTNQSAIARGMIAEEGGGEARGLGSRQKGNSLLYVLGNGVISEYEQPALGHGAHDRTSSG